MDKQALLPSTVEANIQKPQGHLNRHQLPQKIKDIGKALLHVNQLVPFPKSAEEIKDWAESIAELHPEYTPGHIKATIDLYKTGELKFIKDQGVQQLFLALKKTAKVYYPLVAEIDFRIRRATYAKSMSSNSSNGGLEIKTIGEQKFEEFQKHYSLLGEDIEVFRRMCILTVGHNDIKVSNYSEWFRSKTFRKVLMSIDMDAIDFSVVPEYSFRKVFASFPYTDSFIIDNTPAKYKLFLGGYPGTYSLNEVNRFEFLWIA